TAPIPNKLASVYICIGRSGSKIASAGFVHRRFFMYSKTFWHSRDHTNSCPFLNRLCNGSKVIELSGMYLL
ncbi:hypothetical protein HHI36_017139, partial [Cryptolaemus montrouzieri]